MKKTILIAIILFANNIMAQNLNQYKYVLVPSKYSFLNETDKYRLNTLAKMYMQHFNFETYFDTDNQPDNFVKINCNKLFLDVISAGGMFTTKLTVVLKDCKGLVVYTSKEGISREKEYPVAYTQALRMAFDSMKNLNYKYQESIDNEPIVKEFEGQTILKKNDERLIPIFFSKKITNGFEIYKTKEELAFTILKTYKNNVFIAIKSNITGIIYKLDGRWFFDYYLNEKLISEEIFIDFDN